MYCMQYDVRFSKFFQVRCYVLIFIRPPPPIWLVFVLTVTQGVAD
uniref:Uncharacterized protein n=1 Tax=Anguilla anguilla TaxID=7936 RepID=A0A0E9VNH1_ANGAN